ncbi:hypothetical protein TNCV_326111 [Trichonephila clavipes]|nr:hypothetical protein TNCV_326111 [Trichonephila clavipes]
MTRTTPQLALPSPNFHTNERTFEPRPLYTASLQRYRARTHDTPVMTTRGLLATDHVILNHGQVTWTTPELAPPSPNYHTTPTGGRFSSRQI